MNVKSIFLVMLALGCGLVAAVGIFQYLEKIPSLSMEETRTVVVAAKEIDIKSAFTEDNIQLVEWPRSRVPLGAIGNPADLKDKFARTRLYEGEAILATKVMDENDNSGSLKVPTGYRVVSVKVNSESSVSNLIEPGDRVDVVAVLRKSQENPTAIAKTILTAVRVFAVNSDMDREAEIDESKSPDEARTVSLLVKPAQAERMMMAAEVGRLLLSLRGHDDNDVDQTPGATLDKVLGRSEVADELDDHGNLVSVQEPGPPLDPSAEEYWKMNILTPSGSQQYIWTSEEAEPQRAIAVPPKRADSSGNGSLTENSQRDDQTAYDVSG